MALMAQIRVAVYKSATWSDLGRIVASWVAMGPDDPPVPTVFMDESFWMGPPYVPRPQFGYRSQEQQKALFEQFRHDVRTTSPHLRP